MAFKERNEAYDISLFEQNAENTKADNIRKNKKKDNLLPMPKGKFFTKANAKRRAKQIAVGVTFSAAAVSMIAIMIVGQVQLTELNQQISNANQTLAEQQSVYTQTEMKVEAKLSTAVVEEYAKTNLGMSKADSYQKTYIALSNGDKAQVVQENSGNLLESITNAISGMWS